MSNIYGANDPPPLPPGISPPPAQAVQDAIDAGETDPGVLAQIAREAGASGSQAQLLVSQALGSTPDFGPTFADTDVPTAFLRDVAEELAIVGEDGMPPDPMVVIANMADAYGLTSEQQAQANATFERYREVVRETTAGGPLAGTAGAEDIAPGPLVMGSGNPPSATAAQRRTLPDADEIMAILGQQQTDTATARRDAALADATSAATDYLAEHITPEALATGSYPELPDELRPSDMTDQEYGTWLTDVQEEGRQAALEAARQKFRDENPGSSDEEIAATVDPLFDASGINQGIPPWMLQAFGGVRVFNNPGVKQRIVDYWNDNYNTNFTDFSQVAPLLETLGPTTEATEFVQSALNAQEPLLSHGIVVPFVNGARRVNYSEDEMQAFREMGFDNDAVTRLTRLSALSNHDVLPPDGDLNSLDINTFATAGLFRYFGAGPELSGFNRTTQQINQLERQMGLSAGALGRMTSAQRNRLRSRFVREFRATLPSGAPTSSFGSGPRAQALDRAEGLLQGQGRGEEHGANPGVLAAQNNLRRGMAAYNGDQVLAFVHAIDPALAQRVAASGNDPVRLSWQDNARALDILDRSGLTNRGDTTYERLGGRIRRSLLQQLDYFDTTDQGGRGGGGGGGGGGGMQRRVIDPVSVKEQLKTKFADLMLPDIPDAVVKSVQDMLQGQLDASDPGMSFDVTARIMDWIHGRPEYKEFYGKKPQGMNEAEYQTQFQAGVQDMLGGEADVEAVRSGLRSGDYQAAVGTAAIGGLRGRNSRLMGRWALARQTLDKFS